MTGTPPTARLRHVRSADGTPIAVEQITDGPRSLVTVPGGPSLRDAWAPVGRLLGDRYACRLADRRGRGDSGDGGPYALEREYEDAVAVTSSVDRPVTLCGHSSGAVVALGAVLRGAPVDSLVLYEPPWPVVRDPDTADRIGAVETLVDAGDRDGAVAAALRGMVGVPDAVVESMRTSPAWPVWRGLIHTWPREMRGIAALPDVAVLAGVTVPTLMLVGEHSPAHLRAATDAVAAVLPAATVVELPGQGHEAVATAPDLVAAAIRAHAG